MNVTEIARTLSIPTRELKELLTEFGFSVGHRAIKVDRRIAERILKQGPAIRAAWEERRKKAAQGQAVVVPDSVPKEIVMPADITVKGFAQLLSVPVTTLLGEFMKNGIIVSLNDRLDPETATIIAHDLGRTIRVEGEEKKENTHEEAAASVVAASETLNTIRPPVVVILGHVDHGKTTLLDTIRKSNVVAGESGGITQHIGAYQVVRNGKPITFIDTPGHAAFTTMRSRGAKVADVAILVVAADDGVQPQTKEAIQIIVGSNLPIVVALNKIDKEDANAERVQTQLAELGVQPEAWGGKVPVVPISAKRGTGIDTLLDTVLLVADLDREKRRTTAEGAAMATVIESHVDPGSGPKATVLVAKGTLRRGDTIGVRGAAYGKVRALHDWSGRDVLEAPPGLPVVVLGFKNAPDVGDVAQVALDASTLTPLRDRIARDRAFVSSALEKKSKKSDDAYLPIIIRTDVAGSLEAITLSLEKLSRAGASVAIISKGLGAITESDVIEGEASGATVYGFHIAPTAAAKAIARERNVAIKVYDVIYDLLDDVHAALEARLAPETVTVILGKVQVLARFRVEPKWIVVGGKILEGKITPKSSVRISRKGAVIGEGTIEEVRAGKEIVTEVVEGQEAGMKIFGMTDIQQNDVLDIYREESRVRTLATMAKA